MESATTITLASLSKRTRILIFALVFTLPFLFFYIGKFNYGTFFNLSNSLVLLGSLLAMMVLHELLHGLFFWIFGREVSFGIKLKTTMGPVFWASSSKLYPRLKFQIIGLAPQLLTLALILLATFANLPTVVSLTFYITAVCNFCAGMFDIYLVTVLAKLPNNCLVEDTRDGMRIHGRLGV